MKKSILELREEMFDAVDRYRNAIDEQYNDPTPPKPPKLTLPDAALKAVIAIGGIIRGKRLYRKYDAAFALIWGDHCVSLGRPIPKCIEDEGRDALQTARDRGFVNENKLYKGGRSSEWSANV